MPVKKTKIACGINNAYELEQYGKASKGLRHSHRQQVQAVFLPGLTFREHLVATGGNVNGCIEVDTFPLDEARKCSQCDTFVFSGKAMRLSL